MSREARDWVWEDAPTDDPRQLLILLSLADVADEYGENAYPSKARLARDCRSNERTVQRHLAAMVGSGLIAVEKRATQHRPTTYRMPGVIQGRQSVTPKPPRGDTGETNSDSAPLIGTRRKDVGEGSPTPIIDYLNEILAKSYAEFAGTEPVNFRTDRWRSDMRLLIERGPTAWEKPKPIAPEAIERRIRGIFAYLATPVGARGFCWAANIRSPGALREHWIQIGVEARKRLEKMTPSERTVNRPEVPYDPDAYSPIDAFRRTTG